MLPLTSPEYNSTRSGGVSGTGDEEALEKFEKKGAIKNRTAHHNRVKRFLFFMPA